jgi:hypothetical protein
MMMKKPCIKVYLSGKMTGLTPEQFSQNFKVAEEKAILDLSHFYDKVLIVNPDFKSINTKYGWPYEDCLETDFNAIKICDAIYLLPNWTDSPGAQREYHFAKAYDKTILFQDPNNEHYCNQCIFKTKNIAM